MAIKLTFDDMGWSEQKWQAANRAAKTVRRGEPEPLKHSWMERMDKEEVAAHIELVDGWVNAYQYALEHGVLFHPTGGEPVKEWDVTESYKDQMTRLIGLAESILRRARRHAEKLGGSK